MINAGTQSVPCTLHARKRTARGLDLERLTTLVAGKEGALVLGGHDRKDANHRFSYWAAEPRQTVTLPLLQTDPWTRIEASIQGYHLHRATVPELPIGIWTCGWAGYFAYEMGRTGDPLPESPVDDLHLPGMALGFYDRLLALDHQTGDLWLLALDCAESAHRAQTRLDELEAWLAALSLLPPIVLPEASDLEVNPETVQCNMARDTYLASIRRILRYIRDGETYQINLSRRFAIPYPNDPVRLFLWQNRYNPSPYAAYLAGPGYRIICTSPELFLDWQGESLRTQPIKGTRARWGSRDPDQDRQNYRDLVESSKEQAELNMIIDLERNDMARLCIPGTRQVVQPRTIASYATVYHAMATVGGILRPGLGFADIMRAMSPGGPITGAPKIRAMEIIAELEPTVRSVYTGCIGWIGLQNAACLNIAIRTIIITDQTAYVQAGGGIVADSDAESEYQETVIKARALLAGIAACRH
jgi:para-aminobenzoate synthetase component 1